MTDQPTQPERSNEADQLRAKRLALNLNLREAAKRLRITPRELSDLENERLPLGVNWLRLMSELERE